MKIIKFLIMVFFFQVLIYSNAFGEKDVIHKIAIYSDSRTNHEVHKKIVDDILGEKPVAVFHVGDMVEFPWDRKQWEIFNNIISKLKENSKIYPVIGNRDKNSKYYYETFNLAMNKNWYSVDIDKIHFIILDSNSSLDKSSVQYKWLISDIDSDNSVNSLFRVMLFHHPVISSCENDDSLKNILLPLLIRYKIDVVFNGHNHGYERLKYEGINFIITAGGGAPLDNRLSDNPYSKTYRKIYNYCILYLVNKKMVIEAYDENKNLFDKLEIDK